MSALYAVCPPCTLFVRLVRCLSALYVVFRLVRCLSALYAVFPPLTLFVRLVRCLSALYAVGLPLMFTVSIVLYLKIFFSLFMFLKHLECCIRFCPSALYFVIIPLMLSIYMPCMLSVRQSCCLSALYVVTFRQKMLPVRLFDKSWKFYRFLLSLFIFFSKEYKTTKSHFKNSYLFSCLRLIDTFLKTLRFFPNTFPLIN